MKRELKHFVNTVILPFVLQLFIRFIYLSSKKRFFISNKLDNSPILVAFWHNDLIMQPYTYKYIRPKGTIRTLISDHRDGESITKTVEYLGIGSIRGSSSSGGVRALLAAIKELKSGIDVAITPDGPRGPRYSVADGIVAIAQKSGAKIVIFNTNSTKFWRFNSWDKFVIPKPFGQIDFFVSDPLDISGLELEEAKELIKEKMMIHTMKDEDEK
ncbi:MAG: lysophospholipid acyltransferase family protein [Arcobacteraceae bacterium]|nr:lysophospholipid acyltransferase family protein [Arcobacteraceae bacterium]MDY0364903.1 lysophospholipid acyltransferase family protein [Arcobacteraceae bacterium]